jgi:hypothetical protein
MFRTAVRLAWWAVLPWTLLAVPPSVTVTNVARTEAGLSLKWTASSPELQFTVESQDSLGAAWQPVPGPTWPAIETQFTDTRPAADARFYRVAFEPKPGQRGRLISATKVSTLNKAIIGFIFSTAGISLVPQYDVDYFKVVYETVDAQGLRTTASGGLALPVGLTAPKPLMSYQHGTVTEREDVPSRLNTEGYIGVAFATSGYAAVLPDYVGLGDSPGVHPYMHAQSHATATIDLLRAARTYCSANGIALNDKLFLTGYSQGGHATLAALREIEAAHAAEFPVTACSAGAGAYDLSGTTLQDLLQGQPEPNPYYAAFLLNSYTDVYGLAPSLGALLRQPWKVTIPPLFNGLTSGDTINAAMPPAPLDALDSELVSILRSGQPHPLRSALQDNDLLAWVPKAPLRLYACSGDQDVPPANSKVAYDGFRASGATQVTLQDPGPGLSHGDCAIPTIVSTLQWFNTLR